MKNDLFLLNILTVLAIFLAGYIGSLIYYWFGIAWMITYIIVLAIVVIIILGRKLKI